MKKVFFVVIFITGFFTTLAFFPVLTVHAGETEVLIKKLIQRGILSKADGEEMLNKVSKSKGTETTMELPNWVKNIKLKGDLRFRYQYEDTDNDGNDSRDRYRIRLRLGAETKVNDKWKAGFGLSSGGDDPRSTNQTLENTFQSPDVRIDYAYAKFTPSAWASLMCGKFKNPIWGAKDLLWDGDIRPDGAAAHLKFKAATAEIFMTPAYFILDEYKTDKNDPAMWLVQIGTKVKMGKAIYFEVAGTYDDFSNVTGNRFEHSAGTNSVDSKGRLTQNYDSLAVDGEFAVHIPGPVPLVAAFGQYVKSDADDDGKGWLVGIKFGHKKVKQLGQWQVKYNYRRLEKDAWPDFLPDSDFYGGKTDSKGNEVEFKLGLAKHVAFGLDYYFDVKPINGDADREQKLLQADLVLKW